MSPKISVITAVFNGAETIEKCIESVHRQTYGNREHIIIDGGSTDGTVDVLEKHSRKLACWVSEPDQGIYDAWNKALAHASGDWICFLGADDCFWGENVLKRLRPHLDRAEKSSIKLVYGKLAVVDKENALIRWWDEPWESAKEKMRNLVLPVPHPGLMHHRSWFEIYGDFDISFRISGDYEILMRGWPNEEAIYADDVVVAGMRLGGISSTHKGRMTIMKESHRIQRKYNMRPTKQFRSMVFGNYLRSAMIGILGERITYSILDTKRKIMGQPLLWTRL